MAASGTRPVLARRTGRAVELYEPRVSRDAEEGIDLLLDLSRALSEPVRHDEIAMGRRYATARPATVHQHRINLAGRIARHARMATQRDHGQGGHHPAADSPAPVAADVLVRSLLHDLSPSAEQVDRVLCTASALRQIRCSKRL